MWRSEMAQGTNIAVVRRYVGELEARGPGGSSAGGGGAHRHDGAGE